MLEELSNNLKDKTKTMTLVNAELVNMSKNVLVSSKAK